MKSIDEDIPDPIPTLRSKTLSPGGVGLQSQRLEVQKIGWHVQALPERQNKFNASL